MPAYESLYRTVQRQELGDLVVRRAFRTVPASIEGKHFWTTREDAERFARLLLARCGIGPSWIVEAHVQAAALNRLATLVADGRPARFVHEEELDWFNDVVMDIVIPASEPYSSSNG